MNKSFWLRFSFSLVAVAIFFTLFSGCKKDAETTYYDSVVLSSTTNSLAFLITSSIIPPAGDYGLPVMEEIANGSVSGLATDEFFYMSLYPHLSDNMYNPFAENFMFKFDENGDDTFENYPSFINNLTNYSYELDDFSASVVAHQDTVSIVRVGNLVRSSNGVLNMYVKLKYYTSFEERHSVAVYLYEKEVIGSQETINGTVENFVHKNVFSTYVGSQYGVPITGTFDANHETELFFTHDWGSKDLSNLGILTVVYKLNCRNEPTGVFTVYKN